MIEIKEKHQTLKKRVKAMEGSDIFGVTATYMCLVSDLVIPTKFETPDFEKYKDHTCQRRTW